MIVTYSPDGEEPQRFEFDPKRVRSVQAEVIEKKFDGTWEKFRLAVFEGSAKARRVLLWHLLKTQHVTLRLEDVDFALGELLVEMTRGELTEFREAAVKSTSITEEQRELTLAAIDAEIATAPGDVEGKAPSKKSG